MQCFQNDPEWESVDAIPIDTNYVSERIGNTSWCTCEHCIPMPTFTESKCCQEEDVLNQHFDNGLTCITQCEDLTEVRLSEEMSDIIMTYNGRVTTTELQQCRNR